MLGALGDMLDNALEGSSSCVTGLGYILILIATILIGGLAYVYFSILLPVFFDSGSLSHIFMMFLGIYIVASIEFNYIMCVRTKPGTPDSSLPITINPPSRPSSSSSGSSHAAITINNEDDDEDEIGSHLHQKYRNVPIKQCSKCYNPKPLRTHHCQICKVCVFKYDHHCPWINNCVGLFNYRYFVNFLAFTFFGCFLVALLGGLSYFYMTPDARSYLRNAMTGVDHNDGTAHILTIEEEQKLEAAKIAVENEAAALFAFVMCISLGVALFGFLSWHLYLLFSNQTTVEFHMNKHSQAKSRMRGEVYFNEFDLGWRKNLYQVYGPKPLQSLLIPTTRYPSHLDGVRWPTVYNSVVDGQMGDDIPLV